MSQPQYVHGHTDAREVARLEKQADFTASFTFSSLDLRPGQRVLDLATGVGAMGARLALAEPGAAVVGVDLVLSQLAAARRNHPELPVVRGDATQLPFADGTFDRVHCSWLLEHVPNPRPIVLEVHRVLAPGGFCQFIEVDNSTFSTTPPCSSVMEMMDRLNQAQRSGGGDPFVGKHLPEVFRAAGFEKIEIERPALRGDARNPLFFQSFVDEFAEIFEGLDELLGAPSLAPIDAACAHLRALPQQEGAALCYTPTIVRAWK